MALITASRAETSITFPEGRTEDDTSRIKISQKRRISACSHICISITTLAMPLRTFYEEIHSRDLHFFLKIYLSVSKKPIFSVTWICRKHEKKDLKRAAMSSANRFTNIFLFAYRIEIRAKAPYLIILTLQS